MTNRYLRLAICLFIYLLFNNVVTLVFLSIYWFLTYKDKTTIIILLFILIPNNNNYKEYMYNNGRIIDINANSVIIENNNDKLSVITDTSNLSYDDIISFNSKVEPIENTITTYGFNFTEYYYSNKVYNSTFADKVSIISKGNTIRNKLYTYINDIEDENTSKFYKKMFFNIKDKDIPNLLMKLGFQYSGLLIVLSTILKYFFYEKTNKIIEIIVIFVLMIVFGFNLILFRLLINRFLYFTNYDSKDRLGITALIIYIIFPYNFLDLVLLYPFGFSLISIFYYKHKTSLGILFSVCIQSFYFYKFNILYSILYRYLIFIYGIIFILMIILLPFNYYVRYIFEFLIFILDMFEHNIFYIKGKINIIIFIILYLFYKCINNYYILIIALVLLMKFKVFTPFTEVSFINVKQGDSVLFKSAFNREVILYDTGKPSSYLYVKAYLDASGIDTIDYLIVSHNDIDHSGNVENIINEYDVKNLILQAQDINGIFKFKSLYMGEYDNDNDNSLIYYTSINDYSILLTGDISKKVENKLVATYDKMLIDILKVSHHGSNTSTSEDFIQSIKPQFGIISSGKTYNHPAKEVLDTLNNNNIINFDTKINGDIKYIFSNFIDIMISSDNKYIILEKRE